MSSKLEQHQGEREASLVLQAFTGSSTFHAWFAEDDETEDIMRSLGISNPVHPDNLQWALWEFVKGGFRVRMTQPVSSPSYNVLGG